MDVQTLQKHLLTLATIEATDAPMVSCYLNLETGLAPAWRALDQRVRLLRKTLSAPQRGPFEQALCRIDSRLKAGFGAETLGVAIFARGGENEFFLDLAFRVPLPTWIAIDTTPNIYHLVELKDTYDRYVVVLANERNTRILEVHLGSVTEAVWTKRHDPRKRIGRGLSRKDHQGQRREPNH